jgi:pyruvate/2-oxoglutarate dehydrogenase complex dihydrolipoamide acyltransferase (E2) component
MTVESDKATMEIPAPFAGTVREFAVSIGTRVSQGALLLTIEAAAAPTPKALPETAKAEAAAAAPVTNAEPHGCSENGSPADREQRAGSHGRRPRRRPCDAVGARFCPRAGRRPWHGEDLPAPRAGCCVKTLRRTSRNASQEARRSSDRFRYRGRPAGLAGGRLREVRPGRAPAAVAHPEDLGRQSDPQLADHSACHQFRQCRRDQPGRVPQGAQCGPTKTPN